MRGADRGQALQPVVLGCRKIRYVDVGIYPANTGDNILSGVVLVRMHVDSSIFLV